MNYYSDSAPTQYAETYCDRSRSAGMESDLIRKQGTDPRNWNLPIMLAGLVMLTALVLTFVISTAVKFSDPVNATPSVVVTNPVTTVTNGNGAPQSSAQPTAVVPTNATQQPITVTRSAEPAPATMTNPLEPAPATMTNPLEPAPATMTNPLEPAPATMTNPLEPAPVGSIGSGE